MPHASHNLTCDVCKKSKELKLFSLKQQTADAPVCKACLSTDINYLTTKNSEFQRKANLLNNRKFLEKKNKKDEISRHKIYYDKMYKQLRDEVLGLFKNKCNDCGETDKIVLQVDHINGGGTKERKTINSLHRYRLVLKNPDKYQILCANCNVRKKNKNKEM